MNNTATFVGNEVVATDDCSLSEEFVAEVIAREKHIDEHPDEWITSEESIKRLRERALRV